MQSTLRVTARVLPGSRIEVSSPELTEGEDVEVIVQPAVARKPRTHVIDIIESLPRGPRSAPTWDEVERNLQEERNSWER
jgi:hypothetical protein